MPPVHTRMINITSCAWALVVQTLRVREMIQVPAEQLMLTILNRICT